MDRRAWDRDGMLLADINADGAETRYVYDAAGNLTAVTDAQGNVTRIDYGEDNLPATVTDALGHATHSRYDAAGRLLERNDALGRSTRYAYDGKGRLATAVRTFPTSRIVARYSYDAFGRRIAKRVDEQRWAEGETPPSVGQAHAGELTLFVWDGDVMVQEVHGDRTLTYVYEPDSFVPLARVESIGGIGAADPEGVNIEPISEWQQIFPEIEPDAHILVRLTHLSEEGERTQRVFWQQRLTGAEVEVLTDRLLHYQCDQLGAPTSLIDDSGTVEWERYYYAWGNLYSCSKRNAEQFLRFQGQYEDAETGLYYNRNRYYDPAAGRYVTQDPIKLLGGANLYSYVPNPNQWTDPLGLKSEWQTNWEAVHGPLPDGYQVHHIIPKSASSVAAAKKLCPSFNVHDERNLIALPKDSSVTGPTNRAGFGKTTHQGYHAGYSQAAEKAMAIAPRIKIDGVSGCAKLTTIQSALRAQLESGGQTMYGNQHPGGVPGVLSDWKSSIRNYLRLR